MENSVDEFKNTHLVIDCTELQIETYPFPEAYSGKKKNNSLKYQIGVGIKSGKYITYLDLIWIYSRCSYLQFKWFGFNF